MTIEETADTFIQDFGVAVTWGMVSAVGILDMPDQVVGEYGISTEYSLLVKTSVFSSIARGDSVTIDGSGYTVREAKKIDDGVFTRITLTKT